MRRKRNGAIEWLEFDLLADVKGLKHAVFLKHGGVSQGPYTSLNAGAGTSDHLERVETNLDMMRQTLRLDRLVKLHQVHGVNIVSVPSQEIMEGDALVTKEKGVGLTIRHADCQATIIYDPKHHAVANIHCGWRGNVQNIYAKTIRWLEQNVGSQAQDLLVCVGPSLGPAAAEFKNYASELPESFLPFRVHSDSVHFNLWEVSRYQLLEAGIDPAHIEMANMCTLSHPEDFFSYRREKDSGRHATIVSLI
jgi:polyphenol oxidase